MLRKSIGSNFSLFIRRAADKERAAIASLIRDVSGKFISAG
jgi:hypothetical protein